MVSPLPTSRSYGTWPSSISVDAVAQQAVGYEDIAVDPITQAVFHSERRPSEGRTVIVKSYTGSDAIGKSFNARTLVNGYGGVPMAARDGVMVFSNLPDNRLYKVESASCTPITADRPEWRFADIVFHPLYPKFLVCVFENQTPPRALGVENSLAVINIDSGDIDIVSEGWDFYASPVVSPGGKQIAFLRWNHPNMPWQSCQLVVADIVPNKGSFSLQNEKIIAGESNNTVAQQPQWASDTVLLFAYDKLDWTQIWKYVIGAEIKPVLQNVVEEEFADPLWRLGETSYTILDNGQILCKSVKNGFSSLSLAHIETGTSKPIDSPYVSINAVHRIDSKNVAFIGSKVDETSAVVQLTVEESLKVTFSVLVSSSQKPQNAELVPKPRMLELKDDQGRPLYALYHPPTNPDFVGLPDEKPPCLMSVHGGPTLRTDPGFNWSRTMYTSRGWSWLAVYYGGSTGFGRKYIDRLNRNWGALDPADCAAAARQAIELGLIDAQRIVTRGDSAGGYNVLQSLILFPDVYACGTAYFGISDLKRLHETTHKFQSQYIPGLVGGTPDEVPEVYKSRSPLFNADKIRAPLLLLHGTADIQVPLEQTESIARVIRQNGGRVELKIFEGEGHGFRLVKNIKASLEKELTFYEEILGLKR